MEIYEHFQSFFRVEKEKFDDTEILGVIPRQITEEINTKPERGVTYIEIRVTAFQLRGKSTGFTWFLGLLYQRSWRTIGPNVITTVSSFSGQVSFSPL